MSNDALQNLVRQVSLFRQWASRYPPGHRYGEWECDYEGWPDITQAFERFLDACPFVEWSQQAVETVLYIIARDNEAEVLAWITGQDPQRLLNLARASLLSAERDAKWQLAVQLGRYPEYVAESEPILVQLVHEGRGVVDGTEPSEYPSRRALMELGRLRSGAVEGLVSDAWATGYEYQRIAVLSALFLAGSPLLEQYLRLAEADGSGYLRAHAGRVRSGRLD